VPGRGETHPGRNKRQIGPYSKQEIHCDRADDENPTRSCAPADKQQSRNDQPFKCAVRDDVERNRRMEELEQGSPVSVELSRAPASMRSAITPPAAANATAVAPRTTSTSSNHAATTSFFRTKLLAVGVLYRTNDRAINI
jgi:hypothetical protein